MVNGYKGSIAVLYTNSVKCNKKKLAENKNWKRVHSIFSKRANKHELEVYFAHYKEYEDGKLKRAWTYRNNRWVKVKNQEIDLVYSRFARTIFLNNQKDKKAVIFKYRMAEQVSLINHPLIDEFCWDKRIVSEFFPEFTPKTFLVNTLRGLKTVLPGIKSEKIVLKPRYGTLGENVIITDKNELPEKIEKNTIVQELIDTSNGIKDLVKGWHDLRLIMANGEIDHAFIRVPKNGLFVANIALGGKKIFIKNKQIPKNVIRIAKKIDRLFKEFKPRLYSIDFLINKKQKPYIVECNSQPMIDKYAFGKYAHLNFYDRIFALMRTGIKIKIIKTI